MNIYLEKLLPDNPALPVRCWRRQGYREETVSAAPYASHWHEMIEIVYTRSGHAIQQSAQSFYPVSPGDLSVIPPNQLHSYTPTIPSEYYDLTVLQFDVSFVVSLAQGSDVFSKDWLSGNLFFPAPVKANERTLLLLDCILNEIQERREGYIQAVSGALLQLLVFLYRSSPVLLSSPQQKTALEQCRPMLSNTFDFISDRYQDEGLSVRQAADNACLSISHFCRLFKQITGRGFHEYLLLYRLSRAEQLFSSGLSLSEIAFSCGFGSLSAFTRAFKKCRGCTPSRARRQCL